MATSPKGFTQIEATAAPDGPSQINGAELFLEGLIGENVATPGDLPASGNWKGRTIWVASTACYYTWTGTAWFSGLFRSHVEYLFDRSAIGDGVTALFTISTDSTLTTDSTFTTVPGSTGNTFTLVNAGIYSIDVYAQVGAASTGRFAVSLTQDGATPSSVIANNSSPSGENILSVSLSNFKAAAGAVLQLKVEKHTSSNADIKTRIRITRLGV
jgi:hypothetical protein